MSMWDSDIIFGGKRLDETYDTGVRFILDAIEIAAEDIDLDGDPNTNNATKTLLTTRALDSDGHLLDGDGFEDNDDGRGPIVVGTFASAIADKARKVSEGDLPAVITTLVVPSKTPGRNDARVIQFVRKWVEPPAADSANAKAAARKKKGTDGDDVPF